MNFEPQLKGLQETIKTASFNKVTLEQFKKIPEILRPAFLSDDDNDAKLAVETYAQLLTRSLYFLNEVKEGKIKPNSEGLELCEELVDAVYEENKFLIATFPQIATEGGLGNFQQLLPEIKTAIRQKKSEIPPKSGNDKKPSNSWGGVIVILLIIGIVLLVGIFAYKRKRK